MMTRVLLLVATVGCGVDETAVAPDAAVLDLDSAVPDARTDLPDDGFGFSCNHEFNPTPPSRCYPDSGLVGVCIGEGIPGTTQGVCRRICPGTYPNHGCPPNQVGVPTIGWAKCICKPSRCVFPSPLACSVLESDIGG